MRVINNVYNVKVVSAQLCRKLKTRNPVIGKDNFWNKYHYSTQNKSMTVFLIGKLVYRFFKLTLLFEMYSGDFYFKNYKMFENDRSGRVN